MQDQAALLTDVQAYLDLRRKDYVNVLQAVLRDLAEFRDHSNNRLMVYRIYSRMDKQVGSDPLKTDWKIARKLAEWRRTQPNVQIRDLHDIIGVTVVTYFSSQIDTVVAGLCKGIADGGLDAYDRSIKDEYGYHAVHLKVKRTEPRYFGLLCEIQVKTLLHDGWATKTHDLTYKPQGKTSADLIRQMGFIGDGLQLFEQHSDILRQLIEREWHRERRHRERAQHELLVALAQDATCAIDDEVVLASTAIKCDHTTLASCSESDPVVRRHFDAWRALVKAHGHGRQTCRLITLLASIRESRDLDAVAFDAIDSWIASSLDNDDRLTAMHFRALAAYGFNNIEKAIELQRKLLLFAKQHSLKTTAVQMNLAYYLAEGQFRGVHDDAVAVAAEARSLLSTIEAETLTEQRKTSFLDSTGAVEIAFGDTEEKVRLGLKLCNEALDATPTDSPYRPRLEAYYRLHEERAWRRISEEWP